MNSPVEEIKSRLNVVDVIQGYVRLTKAGINYKANCPFHGEKTPSFFVSPTRQIWHCFGCGRGGDIFKFVMEIEGHEFPEALRLLATRAGVLLRREDPKLRSERNRLYDLSEEAAKIFEGALSVAPVIKRYVESRGITPETIQSFRVGYAPKSWDTLLRALSAKGFSGEETEKAGLAIRSEDGKSRYDRFRGRIIFPILDQSSRVIGFGGRIFETEKSQEEKTEAKYINTPQTLIYDKSKVLYAFDRAKQDIRVKGAAVVVEGYMDCVMSHQAGVTNTIAVSGTAFTPQQLAMVKRLADTLLFSFDSDAAGESATRRSLALSAEFEFERKIIEIPSGKDPADAVKESPETWRTAVEQALPIVDFYYKKAFSRFDPDTPDGKREISSLLLPFISELKDEIQRAHWVLRLSEDLGIPREAVQKELDRRTTRAGSERAPIAVAPEEVAPKRRDLLEERFLAILSILSDPSEADAGASPHIEFSASQNNELFAILRAGAPDTPVPEHLAEKFSMLRFKGEIIKEMVPSLAEELRISERELERACVRERLLLIGNQIARLERSGDSAHISRLLADFQTLSLHLKSIT